MLAFAVDDGGARDVAEGGDVCGVCLAEDCVCARSFCRRMK